MNKTLIKASKVKVGDTILISERRCKIICITDEPSKTGFLHLSFDNGLFTISQSDADLEIFDSKMNNDANQMYNDATKMRIETLEKWYKILKNGKIKKCVDNGLFECIYHSCDTKPVAREQFMIKKGYKVKLIEKNPCNGKCICDNGYGGCMCEFSCWDMLISWNM